MTVYRIAKTTKRATELTGLGAFIFGGRRNNIGTNMLYCSVNSSLAYLQTLVHLAEFENPPYLFIAEIEIADDALIYHLPEHYFPQHWLDNELFKNKLLGDKWMSDGFYLGIKVKSAINPKEYNILLNPQFPKFDKLVKIIAITKLPFDPRLHPRRS